MTSMLLLYTNDTDHICRHPGEEWQGRASKYFETANIVKEYYGDIWHCSLTDLQAVVEGEKLNAYLAIQFLRCIIDSLERQFLDSGRYADKREELTEARGKVIHQFLILDQGVLRLINFLANTFFVLQGVGSE